jgi:hypothetical protein
MEATMGKKTEHEVIMQEKFTIEVNGNEREATLTLRRFGARFYVDRSGFVGPYAMHTNSFEKLEDAYEEFNSFLNIYA